MQVLRGIFRSSKRFIKPSLFLQKSYTPKYFCSSEEAPFPLFPNFAPPDVKKLDAGITQNQKDYLIHSPL